MILVELKLPTNKYDTMLEFSFAWSSTTNSNTGSLGEILTRLQQDGGQHCGVKQLTILSFAHPRVEVANVILGRNVNDYLPRLLHSCKLSARPYRWFRFGTAGISPFVQLCIYFQVNQPVSFRVVILQQIDIIASTKPRTQLTSIFEPVNPSKTRPYFPIKTAGSQGHSMGTALSRPKQLSKVKTPPLQAEPEVHHSLFLTNFPRMVLVESSMDSL